MSASYWEPKRHEKREAVARKVFWLAYSLGAERPEEMARVVGLLNEQAPEDEQLDPAPDGFAVRAAHDLREKKRNANYRRRMRDRAALDREREAARADVYGSPHALLVRLLETEMALLVEIDYLRKKLEMDLPPFHEEGHKHDLQQAAEQLMQVRAAVDHALPQRETAFEDVKQIAEEVPPPRKY